MFAVSLHRSFLLMAKYSCINFFKLKCHAIANGRNTQLLVRLKRTVFYSSLKSQLFELEKLVLFIAAFAHTHFFFDILFQNFRFISTASTHMHTQWSSKKTLLTVWGTLSLA